MQLLAYTAFLAVLTLGDAAGFLGPQHASLVAKEMPITAHSKKAGDGYTKGSPLYDKQQEREKKGVPAAKEAEKKPAALAAPDESTFYKIYNVTPEEHAYRGLTHFLSYFIITMLMALLWTKAAVVGMGPGRIPEGYDERKNNPLGFAYGLFSLDHCFGHHANVCFCTWCCMPLRLADTYSKQPAPLVRTFWTALVVVTCLLGLSQLTLGFTFLIFLCVAVYFRQGLRKKYGLDSGKTTIATDCLTWIFCPFCSMAQEARQVEFVLPQKRGP